MSRPSAALLANHEADQKMAALRDLMNGGGLEFVCAGVSSEEPMAAVFVVAIKGSDRLKVLELLCELTLSGTADGPPVE